MSRPSLELRSGQHLTLTPQLQQSIRLLQLSTLDLEAEISQALTENPLLEREEEDIPEAVPPRVESVTRDSAESDFSAPAASRDNDESVRDIDREVDFGDYSSSGGSYEDDDGPPEAARPDTLREHLIGQLMLTRASARDRVLAGLLIDELDENGYLASALEEIFSWLPPEIDAGVLACARALCAKHLQLLAGGNVARLREALRCDDATIRLARALILRLNPRPGREWTVPAAEYAVPDVIVRSTRAGWQVSLNGAAMPKLRINSLYAQMLGNQRAASHAGLQSQLQQARWMIKNVEQRFDTILRVSQAIVDRQQGFFSKGLGAMRPLILKDIASELGLHESTISRATTQKYMLTPFGTLELKRFFGAGVSTDSGDDASATAVQAFIREMVAEENRNKPLSDNQLTQKLAERGIMIARRTVAKYRETLRISPASQRKSHTTLSK
jgi:RNA polymerase sigma-54 factor